MPPRIADTRCRPLEEGTMEEGFGACAAPPPPLPCGDALGSFAAEVEAPVPIAEKGRAPVFPKLNR